MKLTLLFIIALVFTFCKDNGNSNDDDGFAKPIEVKVEVKDANNQAFTEGAVKVTASVWLHRSFGGWYSIEESETKELNSRGTATFNYGTDQIDPSENYITVKIIEIFNGEYEKVKSDTTAKKIESGEKKTFTYIIQ